MKVRFVFAKNALRHDGAPRAEHLFVVTDRGRLLDRFSDDEPGKWSEVPLPKTHAKRQRKQPRQSRRL